MDPEANTSLKSSEEEDRDLLLKRLTELLETGENCMAWEKLLEPRKLYQIPIVLTTIKQRLQNSLKGREADIDEDGIVHGGCEYIAVKCVEAYLYASSKNVEQALNVLNDTKHSLRNSIDAGTIPNDYFGGISHVLETLEIVAKKLSDDHQFMGTQDLRVYIDTLEQYHRLQGSEMIGLTATKCYFMSNFTNKSRQVTKGFVEQLIEMDPQNPQWYCLLYLMCKADRGKGVVSKTVGPFGRQPPSDTEIDSIRKAFAECPAAKENITLRTYNLWCLSEVFRTKLDEFNRERGGRRTFTDLKYGDLSFNSEEQVAEYLKQEALEVLEINDTSAQTLHIISRIFSSTLPHRFRDLDLADRCISKAVELHPDMSKLSHRKGILCMLKDNYEEGAFFMEKASRLDPRNMNALGDFLQLLVLVPIRSEDEMEQVFKEALDNIFAQDKPSTFSKVPFTVGIHRIMQGRNSEGIELLLKSAELLNDDGPFPHCKELTRQMKKYSRRLHDKFRGNYLKRKLFNAVSGEMADLEDGDKKAKLQKILESLEDIHGQFWQSRWGVPPPRTPRPGAPSAPWPREYPSKSKDRHQESDCDNWRR